MKYELYLYEEAMIVRDMSTARIRVTSEAYALAESIEILIADGGFYTELNKKKLVLLCEFDSYEGLLESNPELFI